MQQLSPLFLVIRIDWAGLHEHGPLALVNDLLLDKRERLIEFPVETVRREEDCHPGPIFSQGLLEVLEPLAPATLARDGAIHENQIVGDRDPVLVRPLLADPYLVFNRVLKSARIARVDCPDLRDRGLSF